MNKDSKKVILFALPDFRGGGAERVFLNLINNLNRNLFEVHVAVGKIQGEYQRDLSNEVYLHELGNIRSIHSILPLLKVIWAIEPDITFSTLGYVVTSSCASIFSPKKTIYIARIGNTLSSFLEEIKKNSRIKFYLQYVLNKCVVYLSDSIIVQSNHMGLDLALTFKLNDKYQKKIIQINNPVEFDSINKNAKKGVIPEIFNNIFKNNFVFVSVGRLEPRKNYEPLLNAFKHVNQAFPSSRLVILGEGKYRPHLENLIIKLDIENKVILPGFIDNSELIIFHSDFFISSSVYEGVSNAILEALALGTPVIATDCPSGIGEIIVTGENGYLIDLNGDIVKNLSDKMSFVIKESKKNNFMNIGQKIKEDFDVKVISKNYEALFLKLIDNKK